MRILLKRIIASCFLLLASFKPASATVLFEDSFNDSDLSGVLTRWEIPRNGCAGDWKLDSGRIGIQITGPSSGCQTEFAPKDSIWGGWNNYIFEVDMTFVGGTDKNIAFRYSGSPNFNWYDYHFQVGSSYSRIFLERVFNSNLYSNEAIYPATNGNTYRLKIVVDGDHLILYIDGNLVLDYPDAGGRFNTGKIALRAGVGADPFTEVYFDNVVVSSIVDLSPTPTIAPSPTTTPTASPTPTVTVTPTQTPTPTSSPTPTPTATPTIAPTATPTPVRPPTRKVVVVPGLGASWNADALLNCKLDGYSGQWTLAPYAAHVYRPLLTALSQNGFTPLPLYYDWRKQITSNAAVLANFINGSVGSEEKVHLIGHSMGGLVGRAYLEQATVGNKIDNLVTAGSPHQGSPLAYPSWSGGEIWNRNIFQRIATTIFLRRCEQVLGARNPRETIQQLIPSTQNILPTFPYLRDESQALKPILSTHAQNNWLPTSFEAPFFGVRVHTLSGRGYETLQYIDVTNRTSQDEQKGNWEDGRPIGREMSTSGDGTVLSSSSQLLGANNRFLQLTHSGLVASQQGINSILDMLGLQSLQALSIQSAQFTEPTSALVIIGHPSLFLVADDNGKLLKDTDEMIMIVNPKKRKYRLGVQPRGSSTRLIVGQFLEDGRSLWKEYQLKNILPKFKTVDFDPDNPKDDPLL